MRVALVTREYPPETSWGGIGTHYGAFARALTDLGCEVEVFTQGIYEASDRDEAGIRVHRVLPRKWGMGRRPGGELAGSSLATIGLFCFALARELAREFAIAHADRPFCVVDSHEHLGIASLLFSRWERELLTVVRYQTPYDSMVRRKMVNWPRSLLVRVLEEKTLRRAHCRISTSRHIDAIVREDFAGVAPADEIIPNMTPLAVGPAPQADSMREELVLFVGRLMPGHKNPDLAAMAFAAVADRHPRARIEFAGQDIPLGTGETMWGRCREILAPYAGRFAYHGVLDADALTALYRRAQVLLMPSSIESYGLVALEAMANGCVPIVTDSTALPEVVGDSGIVVPQGDSLGLAGALDLLLGDEERRRALSAAGLRRAANTCNPAVVARANLDVFTRGLSRIRVNR